MTAAITLHVTEGILRAHAKFVAIGKLRRKCLIILGKLWRYY